MTISTFTVFLTGSSIRMSVCTCGLQRYFHGYESESTGISWYYRPSSKSYCTMWVSIACPHYNLGKYFWHIYAIDYSASYIAKTRTAKLEIIRDN